MDKEKAKKRNQNKRTYLIIGIIAGTFLLAGGIWLYIAKSMTYPLGDRLEYIGKENYGCWLVCDSNPGSVYYYATDMSVEEVIKYFRKTSVEREPDTADGETYFGLKTRGGETAYLYYYDNGQTLLKKKSLKKTDKRHVLKIPSFKYQLMKESVEQERV